MQKLFIGRLGEGAISGDLATSMFRLRHQVICEKLGWQPTRDNGLETDEYDDEHSIYFILKNLCSQKVEASWRMRPTNRPYMLQRNFRQLLADGKPPCDSHTWEVSRFVAAESASSDQRFALGEASRTLLSTAILSASDYNVHRFVWVTTVSLERLGIRLGYKPRRLGPPVRIGNVLCVAEQIDVDRGSLEVAQREIWPMQVAA